METKERESAVMYLIQFGNYRMYDNARKTLLAARQSGINAVMRYDGEVFRIVSKSTFEEPDIASLMCEVMIRKHERLAYSFVRKTDSF